MNIFEIKIKFFFKTLTAADNDVLKNVKIAVPLKYLGNFWKSVENPLINCEIPLELNWTKDCVMSITADTTFEIVWIKIYPKNCLMKRLQLLL